MATTKREQSCHDLIAELAPHDLPGLCVGHNGGRGAIQLFVYVQRKSDAKKVPTVFKTYPVEVAVVGKIKACAVALRHIVDNVGREVLKNSTS